MDTQMPRTYDPYETIIPAVRVTKAQLAEIDRRAAAARMNRAEYVRERALGRACAPVEPRAAGDGEVSGEKPRRRRA